MLQHLSARVQLYDMWCVHYLSATRHLALSCGGHISRNLNSHAVYDTSRFMHFPISILHQSNSLGDGYLPSGIQTSCSGISSTRTRMAFTVCQITSAYSLLAVAFEGVPRLIIKSKTSSTKSGRQVSSNSCKINDSNGNWHKFIGIIFIDSYELDLVTPIRHNEK